MLDANDVEVEWAEIVYRPEETLWEEDWTVLPMPQSKQILSQNPILLTEYTLPAQTYIHLFTDALGIKYQDEELADIIEPISCPIPAFGHHRITITYIIIEKEIFAMDCIVQ
jgi:hypothetical protein